MEKIRMDVIMTKALFCLVVIGWSLQLINILLLDLVLFCFKMQSSKIVIAIQNPRQPQAKWLEWRFCIQSSKRQALNLKVGSASF